MFGVAGRIHLTYKVDEFIEDKPLWVAWLSNGKVVYQDDGRPGVGEPSAWKRLRRHCEQHKLWLTRLGLKFRSHEQFDILPKDAEAYFFCNRIFAVMGSEHQHRLAVVGHKAGDQLHCKTFKVPELLLFETDTRGLDECLPECVIGKPDGWTVPTL